MWTIDRLLPNGSNNSVSAARNGSDESLSFFDHHHSLKRQRLDFFLVTSFLYLPHFSTDDDAAAPGESGSWYHYFDLEWLDSTTYRRLDSAASAHSWSGAKVKRHLHWQHCNIAQSAVTANLAQNIDGKIKEQQCSEPASASITQQQWVGSDCSLGKQYHVLAFKKQSASGNSDGHQHGHCNRSLIFLWCCFCPACLQHGSMDETNCISSKNMLWQQP